MSGYGGESMAKKLARVRFWIDVIGPLMGGHDGKDMMDFRYLVLASADAGDVRILRAMGVPASNIIAVDTDAAALEHARAAHPYATYVHGDALDVCRRRGRTIDVMFLDFCMQLNRGSVDYFSRCADACVRNGGVAAAGFSYGREVGAAGAVIKSMKRQNAKRDPTPPRAVKKFSASFGGREIDEEGGEASGVRLGAFVEYAHEAFMERKCCLVTSVNTSVTYVSRTEAKVGTPMFYVGGTVNRRLVKGGCYSNDKAVGAYAIRGGYKSLYQQVRTMTVHIARVMGSGYASDVMGFDKGRVAAWLAVDTMRQRRAS